MHPTNIIMIILLFFVATTLLLFLHNRKLKKQNKQRYLQGLQWLNSFRSLLTSIQQHRGLTMGYLNGDQSLHKHIDTLKIDINQQIAVINNNKGWTENNQVWDSINNHWLRLSVSYTKYAPPHNFKQHCNLIASLLNLIEDCADNHHLQELVVNNKEYANFLWAQLLTTAENIGQVRAIGTSIAAAKISTSTQRIKLNYLQNCINEFLQEKNQDFDSQLLTQLLVTTNEKLLTDKVEISAEDFFNLSTKALDALLAKFDCYLHDLHMNIDKV